MNKGLRSSGSHRLAILLFLATAAIDLAGAASAAPGIGVAVPDLDLLRHWRTTGRVEDHPGGAHLTKGGYLLYLRALLPSEGRSEYENRRFLFANALWLLAGEAAAALALWRAKRRIAALALLSILLLYTPLRDSADYVGTEPMGAGLCLLFGAGLIALPSGTTRRAAWLGLLAAVTVLVRPNLGWILFACAIAVLFFSGVGRTRLLVSLFAGLLLGVALLAGGGRLLGLPLSPFGVNTSKALLWGTADYYWQPDIGPWPAGANSEATSTLEWRKARDRWLDFFRHGGPDVTRSLIWRLTHPLLSAEELPALVKWPSYRAYDRAMRRFWFVPAIALAAAATAAASRGVLSNPFSGIPLLLLFAFVVQGLIFGADPRLTLALMPLLFLALLLAGRGPVPRGGRAGSAAVVLGLAAAVAQVPDTVSSDYVLIRGPGRVLNQSVPPGHIPRGPVVTVHCRILRPDPFRLGIEIRANGMTLVKRDPADPSPFPAFFTGALTGDALRRARERGLDLEARTLGTASSTDLFVYSPLFPAIAEFSAGEAAVDGNASLSSGYGGATRGRIPLWMHSGADRPR